FIEKACFSAITKMMQNKELKQIVLCIIVSQTRYANNDFLANMRRYCIFQMGARKKNKFSQGTIESDKI
ncbi:MAG: hypothetical protein DRN11_01610, partial [Thermoplasmata archaeon]